MSEDRAVNCPTCSTKCTIVKFCGCKESGCDGDPHYVINESYYRKKFEKEFPSKKELIKCECGKLDEQTICHCGAFESNAKVLGYNRALDDIKKVLEQ